MRKINVKGRSVQKLGVEWKQTDGQTDRRKETIALPPVLTWSVKSRQALDLGETSILSRGQLSFLVINYCIRQSFARSSSESHKVDGYLGRVAPTSLKLSLS